MILISSIIIITSAVKVSVDSQRLFRQKYTQRQKLSSTKYFYWKDSDSCITNIYIQAILLNCMCIGDSLQQQYTTLPFSLRPIVVHIHLLLVPPKFGYWFYHSNVFNKLTSVICQCCFVVIHDKYSVWKFQMNICDRTIVMSLHRIACFIMQISFLKMPENAL